MHLLRVDVNVWLHPVPRRAVSSRYKSIHLFLNDSSTARKVILTAASCAAAQCEPRMRERLDHTGKLRQYHLNKPNQTCSERVSRANYAYVSHQISPGSYQQLNLMMLNSAL